MRKVDLRSVSSFIRTGKTPPTSNPHYFDGSVNWYNPGDFSDNKILGSSKRKITQLSIDEKKAVIFPENTLLLSCIGNIGKVGITKELSSSNQQITGIYPNNDLDVNYLYYSILNLKKHLQDISNSAVVPILNNANLEKIKIPLPPLSEQKRIADLLDAADKLRQKDKALLEKYDQLAQSLFLEMFGDPVKNEKGWEIEKMENLMTIVRGGSPRPIDAFLGGSYPWIKIGDGTRGNDIYIESTKEHIIEAGLKKTRLLPKGSLIFANCGVSLGFARIITFEGCIHDGWLAFTDINEDKLNKLFILKTMNSITQYFRDSAPEGTQPNLNISIMKHFDLIIPPISIQNQFAEQIQLIEQQKELAKKNLEKSEELFGSLMGEVFG